MDYKSVIKVYEGFPKEGISFKEISPLLEDKEVFHSLITDMCNIVKKWKPDVIVGPESRGYVFGAPIAYALKAGFVMARKKGKLPCETLSAKYSLEYGNDEMELPKFAIKKGERFVLVDDLLATGGTLQSIVRMIESQGGIVTGIITVIELVDLKGKNVLPKPYVSLVQYEH